MSRRLILLASYLCYVLLLWFLRENVEAALLVSMPLREMYYPSVAGIFLFYIIPLALGYLSGRPLTQKQTHHTILEVLFPPLLLSLLYMAPMLIVFLQEIRADPYLLITLGCAFLLVPTVAIAGSLINFAKGDLGVIEGGENEATTPTLINRFWPILVVALLVALLNTIPVLLCRYPVGNDVWSHAAVSERIVLGQGVFQHPLFLERAQHYPPLVPFVIGKISQATHISTLDLWCVYPIPVSVAFVLLLGYLCLQLTKGRSSAFLSTLLILPWFSLLWPDPSPRLLGLCLMLLTLILCLRGFQGKRWFFILAGISFAGTLLSHLEIALHTIIVVAVMALLTKYHERIKKGLNQVTQKIAKRRRALTWSGAALLLDGLVNPPSIEERFWILLTTYVAITLYFVTLGISYYPDRLLTLSEIGLSLVMPMGAISFIVFLFGLPSLLIAAKRKTPEDIMLVSIAFLYTSVFFCFTKLWLLYHRYFAEVASLSFAMLAALSLSRIAASHRRTAIAIIASVVVLLFASIFPRLDHQLAYAPATEQRVDSKVAILQDIAQLPQNSVILANPEDIINRYIPAMTGKYILCGRSQPTKELQWAVIADMSLTASERQDSLDRSYLGAQFFQDPTVLDEIANRYRVTHVLATREECSRLRLEEKDTFHVIARGSGYVLLEVTNH